MQVPRVTSMSDLAKMNKARATCDQSRVARFGFAGTILETPRRRSHDEQFHDRRPTTRNSFDRLPKQLQTINCADFATPPGSQAPDRLSQHAAPA
jgi:hypothetical protein